MSLSILFYYLLTLSFCYFQTFIYSIILNALQIFFHLQILGNSFEVHSRTHYAIRRQKCWLSTYIWLYSLDQTQQRNKVHSVWLSHTHSLLQCIPIHQKNLSLTTAMFPNYFLLQRSKSWRSSIFLWLWASVLPTQTFKNHLLSAWFLGTHLLFGTNTGRPRRVFCKQLYQTCLISWFSNWSHTSTHKRESTSVIYSLSDTQKCNRHKQLPGNAPWCSLSATLPCNKHHLFMNIPYTKLTLIWLC